MTKENIQDLQAHVANNPRISRIYFNYKGEWQFHERPEYPLVKTRDEVLESEFGLSVDELNAIRPEEEATTVEAQQAEEAVKNISPKKTAAELINAINLAINIDEVNAIVGDDSRKTVTDAAAKKIASLSTE